MEPASETRSLHFHDIPPADASIRGGSEGLRQRRDFSKSSLGKSQSQVHLPRLVARDLPFHQSTNSIQVTNKKTRSNAYPLLVKDWFHVFLRMPVLRSVSFLLVVWTAIVLVFAGIYFGLDNLNKDVDCGLGGIGKPMSWATAFGFSVETCTTVGYTLPGGSNAFFEGNCPLVQLTIFFQMLWSMMFNAFLFAFFYACLAKSENRAMLLVFSDKIVIQTRDDKVFLKAQCYDIDAKHPVVESHVRFYMIDKNLELHQLRINYPTDELGGVIFTSLPAQMTHHIDHHSALSPRRMPLVNYSSGLMLRSSDSATAGREEIICPVCGESYGTYERLWSHVQHYRIVEEKDNYPRERCHLGFEMPDISPITIEEIQKNLEKSLSEIIVVVEGIDPQMSGSFQSLQSYKYEDIVWEGDFVQCLSVKKNEFVVDLEHFNQVSTPLKFQPDQNGKGRDAEQPVTGSESAAMNTNMMQDLAS